MRIKALSLNLMTLIARERGLDQAGLFINLRPSSSYIGEIFKF